ncbi:MAG TPA: phosphoribosylamine--glycine ligase [Verrucomicrobiales bacterium]|nr:phosphoribosylamine--glycine ligase [Verrucomicrobiales bacterium]
MGTKRILVVGKGGREHALARALRRAPSRPMVYAWPGSDAIGEDARIIEAGAGAAALVEAMKRSRIDLCVAGEESYLIDGLADCCAEAGLPCWGPVRDSARLEGSKRFAKEFMERHGVPTAGHRLAADRVEALAALSAYPVVLKFDGLAAGKGVAVCGSREEAEGFLEEVFVARRFGEGAVLVEECLQGPEVSVICAVSDGACQMFTPARDYKRLRNGDTGPNTGGMGAVASRSLLEPECLADIEERVIRPTVEGLERDGMSYRGFLYFGLMLTESGPQVLEFNCRFGDPECQAVLPLVQGDLAVYLDRAARGQLERELLVFDTRWSVCVVLASAGYPQSARSGDRIEGLHRATGAELYHAGTRRNDQGDYETAGGRVLALSALGGTREEAVEQVYRSTEEIRFDGMQFRTDIGRLHFEAETSAGLRR